MAAIDPIDLANFVDRLPAFRSSVQHLLHLAADLNADHQEIVHVIEADPLMTVKILKVVNSPYFGLAQKTSSVQRAVVFLGINSIKNMALSVAAIGMLPARSQAGLDNQAFLLHSLTSAAVCKLLADRLHTPATLTSDYFVAGLLHDFGKIVLAEFMPSVYKQVLRTANEQNVPLIQVESALLGLDHSQAGKLLAQHWGLPENLVTAIDHHHREAQDSALNDCLFAANQIVKRLQFGFAGNPSIECFPAQVERRFGTDLDGLIDDLGSLTQVKAEAQAFID